MRYLLDTNVCIDLIRGRSPRLVDRVTRQEPDAIGLSTITLAELQFGVAKSRNPDLNRVALLEFLVPLAILGYGQRAARMYGKIRASLESAGTPIGPLDTLIASHALAEGLTIVTSNLAEFRRVPDLQVESWSQ